MGSSSYRLKLPANIPPANFWSVTLYEAENASGLANGQPFPRSVRATSRRRTPTAARTSILGPKRPRANKANWLATVPGRGYFAILRLYGPTEAALNKSWKPGDIEKVK